MKKPAADQIKDLITRTISTPTFGKDALAELRAIIEDPKLEEGVEDLRAIPFVTIDNEDTMDLDQAVFIEPLFNGWRVFYALADASYFVRPGMALWDEALARGVSVYIPENTLPMLPAELSEGLISLNPKVDRRALIFIVDVDDSGHVGSVELKRGLIHSHAKLSYVGVQAFLDEPEHSPISKAPYAGSMQLLREVGLARIESARDREALEFDRFDLEVGLSGDRQRFVLETRQRNDVERYNEQISLLCNMEGARLLHEHGRDLDTVQSVFRVHLPPLSQRLRELRDTLATFVKTHELGDEWKWKQGVSLADYLANLPTDPGYLRLRTAVERQVRSANRSSHYSPHAGPHFALGVDQYARFTAPMREIVGIFTHKEALEALAMAPASNSDNDIAMREDVIEAANRGTSRQRTVDKELTLLAIQQDLLDDLDLPIAQRPRRTGTIVGIKPTRFYVLLDSLPMDVKVYLDSLEAQTGHTFEANHVVVSSAQHMFRLGDETTLITHSWDDEQRRIVLIPELLLP